MIYIYDKYFSSAQYPYDRSLYGILKEFYSPINNYMFIDTPNRASIIITHIDATSMMAYKDVEEIASIYNLNPGSKVIIDTSIEDFVKDGFYIASSMLVRKGVEPNDIMVLTGENSVPWFTTSFRIPFPVASVNIFEMSYFLAAIKNDHTRELLYSKVMPRKLTKHFIDFKKNPRFLRKVFHAFMTKHNYKEKSHYSWHSEHAFSLADEHLLNDLELLDSNLTLEENLKLFNKPDVSDHTAVSQEWFIPEEIANSGGINIIHETHPSLDMFLKASVDYEKYFASEYNYHGLLFLTEKTFKNYVYGLPYINPGVPKSEFFLKQFGYKTWDSMFNTKISSAGYKSCVLSYFELLHEIANMPLQDLEDLLNSSQSLDMIAHNRETFIEQRQFKAVVNLLELLWDKY